MNPYPIPEIFDVTHPLCKCSGERDELPGRSGKMHPVMWVHPDCPVHCPHSRGYHPKYRDEKPKTPTI
jgi:hypothetical protein